MGQFSFLVVDELMALEFAKVEAGLSLMEGLIFVELVTVGCAHDVGVHVLLGHEKSAVRDHGVFEEAGTVVESVLVVGHLTFMIKTHSCLSRPPVNFILRLRALNGGSEVSGPRLLLIVRCCVHLGLFTVSSAYCMESAILNWNLNCIEAII